MKNKEKETEESERKHARDYRSGFRLYSRLSLYAYLYIDRSYYIKLRRLYTKYIYIYKYISIYTIHIILLRTMRAEMDTTFEQRRYLETKEEMGRVAEAIPKPGNRERNWKMYNEMLRYNEWRTIVS